MSRHVVFEMSRHLKCREVDKNLKKSWIFIYFATFRDIWKCRPILDVLSKLNAAFTIFWINICGEWIKIHKKSATFGDMSRHFATATKPYNNKMSCRHVVAVATT